MAGREKEGGAVGPKHCQACGVLLTGGPETYGQISCPSRCGSGSIAYKETLYWCNIHVAQQEMYFDNMQLKGRVQLLEMAVRALAEIACSRGWTADLSSTEDVTALMRARNAKT